jgi:predicted nucleic acid-binding protein
MTPSYLLDKNIASYIITGHVPQVRERLLKVPMSQVLISAVTEGSCCLERHGSVGPFG